MGMLDKFDVKILQQLQANARLTNAELAQRVGLSAAPCWRRVQALEEAALALRRAALSVATTPTSAAAA